MVTGVVPSPRFSPLMFIAHTKGSAFPLLVDFSSSVANSRSRPFSESICARDKVPTNLYKHAIASISMHSGGPELTKLTNTRLEDNLIRHRGDRHIIIIKIENIYGVRRSVPSFVGVVSYDGGNSKYVYLSFR